MLSAGSGAEVAAACSSGTIAPAADLGTFDLAGDGLVLRLSGAPADPAYQAAYPIEGLVRMVVRVQANTTLTTT